MGHSGKTSFIFFFRYVLELVTNCRQFILLKAIQDLHIILQYFKNIMEILKTYILNCSVCERKYCNKPNKDIENISSDSICLNLIIDFALLKVTYQI